MWLRFFKKILKILRLDFIKIAKPGWECSLPLDQDVCGAETVFTKIKETGDMKVTAKEERVTYYVVIYS